MSYKTILVHIGTSNNVDQRIELAAQLAKRVKAHLIGVATTGVSSIVYQAAAYGAVDPGITAFLEPLRKNAQIALGKFEQIAQAAGVPSYETYLTDDDAVTGIAVQARYCDLVVMGQIAPDDAASTPEADLPENIVLNGGGPALIVPYASLKKDIEGRVLIAWNGSVEARRAVHDALPILQRAQAVDAVVFQPDTEGEHHGEKLAQFLGRHDIRINVINETAEQDFGDALLSLAANLNADLLVMGCYGHSRFRETLLGGVTRTVLKSMTIPVLMSH